MTMTEVEGAALELSLGVEFLVDVRQRALRRLHDLARVRAGLDPAVTATDAALAAMARAIGLVVELVDEELDDAAWAELAPRRRAL